MVFDVCVVSLLLQPVAPAQLKTLSFGNPLSTEIDNRCGAIGSDGNPQEVNLNMQRNLSSRRTC